MNDTPPPSNYRSIFLFVAIPSALLLLGLNPGDLSAQEGRAADILDFDRDGWDDIWCAVYSEIKHRDRQVDSDRDDVSDYQEMLLWRNPFVNEALIRPPTAQEIAAQQAQAAAAKLAAERAWQLPMVAVP